MKPGNERLRRARLYCFTPDKFSRGRSIAEVVRAQIDGGCDVVQLREKGMTDREKLHLALTLRRITKEKGVLFIVNDDVDIACLSDADGVHLGQDDIPAEHARRLAGGRIIGISTHNALQYRKAQSMDVDYVALGPVFPTTTKERPDPVLGIEKTREILKEKKKITVAIGGISRENLEQVTALPVDMAAVVRDIIYSPDIRKRTREIKKRLWKP